MVMVLPGALSVRCPVCRSQPGRPCHNRRGYLVDTHRLRVEAWYSQEAADTLAKVPSG
jgi:hypothetical protein